MISRVDRPVDSRFARFQSWRDGLRDGNPKRRKFEEWVFLNSAGVFLADKTGELLTLRHSEFEVDAETVRTWLSSLSGHWGFQFAELYVSSGSTKFIVYREERLQRVLDKAPYCVMCGQLNYPCPLEASSFIEELKNRWEYHGEIPHEIGVALGYPLDDVFGYMGLMPLDCKGVCGWQVFGCMEESQRRSCAFNNARCQALLFLAGVNSTACA